MFKPIKVSNISKIESPGEWHPQHPHRYKDFEEGRFAITLLRSNRGGTFTYFVGESRAKKLFYKKLLSEVTEYRQKKIAGGNPINLRAELMQKYADKLPLVEQAMMQHKRMNLGTKFALGMIPAIAGLVLITLPDRPPELAQKAVEFVGRFFYEGAKAKDALLLGGIRVVSALLGGAAASYAGGMVVSGKKAQKITTAFKEAGMALFEKKKEAAN